MSNNNLTPKKKAIFEKAARLFQEKGYPAASMRDLADEVDLKVSSLYSHIGGKEEILQKICFDNARHFLNGIAEIENRNLSPYEQICALVRLHIRIAMDDPTSVTVFNDEWRHLSEPALTEFLKMRKDYETRFARIIRKGMEEGALKKLDQGVVLQTILSAMRWVYYRKPGKGTPSAEQIERDMLTILMSGIGLE
ncbi:MAG: TetR/AcrR family transcriptional regulator [Bacteroidetes bacterium]|nr:MAG: TetR/AcrR family transcriptional regulator [Bacteroidota bacterium]